MSRRKRGQLPSLTGARFIAALGLVFFHYVLEFTPSVHGDLLHDGVLRRIVEQSYLGVDFFFVLSGFILAYSYWSPTSGLRGTRRDFWVARIARIYPVYLLGLAIGIVPFLRYPHHLIGLVATLITAPVFLNAWAASLVGPTSWNPPGWSLAAEALFYALFPFILLLAARLSPRGLLLLAASAWAAFWMIPSVAAFALIRVTGSLPWWWDMEIYFSPLPRLPEFIIGLALGMLFVRQLAQPSRLRALTPRQRDLALLGLAVLQLALMLTFTVQTPGSLFGETFALPVFAAIIYLLAYSGGNIAGLLSAPRLVWLGEISYGVYILHWPLWYWVSAAGEALFPGSSRSLLLLPIYLAALIAVSGLSYTYFETPARRAIRARLSTPSPRAPATRPAVVSARTLPR